MSKGQTVGYVRVSTADQNTERQLDGLQLDKVFTDHASGKDTNRPALTECLRKEKVVGAYLEFYGMILLALGLLTRPIAFIFFVEMVFIVVTIQAPNGYFWTSRGCEFALLLTIASFAFVMGGSGKYSLDRRIGREF